MAVGQGELTHQNRPRSRGTVALLVLVAVGLTSGSWVITGPKEVRGELGQSVPVKCVYGQEYSDYKKRWSKGKFHLSSSTVVSTDHPRQGRTSMTDNKTQRIVLVTIDNLEKSDEGLYWCAIDIPYDIDKSTSISLKVSEGSQTSRPDMVTTTSTTISTRASTTTTLTTLTQDAPTTKEASSTEADKSAGETQRVLQHLWSEASSTKASGSTSPNWEADTFPWKVVLPIALTIVFLLLIAAIILCVKMRQKKKTGSNGKRIISQENPAESFTAIPVIYTTVTTRSPASTENTYMNLQDVNTQGQAKSQGAAEVVYATILTDNN